MDLSMAATKAATFWNRYYPTNIINSTTHPTILSANSLQQTSTSICNNVIPITLENNTNNNSEMTQQENSYLGHSLTHLSYQNYNNFSTNANLNIIENLQNHQQSFYNIDILDPPKIINNKILENNDIKTTNKTNLIYLKKNVYNQNISENSLSVTSSSKKTQICLDENNSKKNTNNNNNVAFDVAARLCSVATIYASRILI